MDERLGKDLKQTFHNSKLFELILFLWLLSNHHISEA